ncbi:hypothetical protein H2LOC_008590 [Methylocystis heyeri]|uniref:Roadblock/LAMTOR2 domain-containing protein n=2 Tax=Methylocystis heyeri TaxID=391905 RepID=A0A6B8KLZ5_9HYPH|nr:hypothetical protein H2LOC_008590 [Methylocystis heyeri]
MAPQPHVTTQPHAQASESLPPITATPVHAEIKTAPEKVAPARQEPPPSSKPNSEGSAPQSRTNPAPLSPARKQENMMSRVDEIHQVLHKLSTQSLGVEGSALISEDGLMIASALGENMEESRVAGITATLLSLGGRASAEFKRGSVQEVIVRGDHGYAVLIGAGRGTLLLALTDETSKLGLVFFDMREAVAKLQNVL